MLFSVCVGRGGCINRLIMYCTDGLVLIILGTTGVSFVLTPITMNQIKTMSTVQSITLTFTKIFFINATTCPCGRRGPPSWAWQECNRRLSLGRP